VDPDVSRVTENLTVRILMETQFLGAMEAQGGGRGITQRSGTIVVNAIDISFPIL